MRASDAHDLADANVDAGHNVPVRAAERVCAIHQPNFFPWLGYFDKIARADAFVFLDAVDYPKSGSGMGSWTNRVKLAVQGEARWVSVPVRREHGAQRIDRVLIDESRDWRKRLIATLQANYARAPGFRPTLALVEELLDPREPRLADMNIRVIKRLAGVLGLRCEFLRQSELQVEGSGTSLLMAITRAARCNVYLAGGGADGYQDDSAFEREGLTLRYQDFTAEPYGDPERWLAGLSVIDRLMWSPWPEDGPDVAAGRPGARDECTDQAREEGRDGGC